MAGKLSRVESSVEPIVVGDVRTPTHLMTPAPRLRRLFRPVAFGMLVTMLVASSGIAGAQTPAPTGSKQEQAAQIQDQIEASDVEISALGERLHEAEAQRDAAQQHALDAEAQIAQAKQEVERIMSLVRANLASLYKRSLRGDSTAELDFSATVDLLKRGKYAKAQANKDDELIEQLAAAQQDLDLERTTARQARDAAAAEGEKIAAAKAAVEGARAEQQAILDKIEGEIAAAVAAEQARRAAAAAQTIANRPAGPEKFPDVGPPNGSASQAIAFARAAVGAGYSNGSDRHGPANYDCSGLTGAAWRAAGVSIAGTSGSQYASLPHVPLNAIQPGDLLFWGAGGSSHVALYIGGGQIIDASSSQNRVALRGIWGSPIGAARVV